MRAPSPQKGGMTVKHKWKVLLVIAAVAAVILGGCQLYRGSSSVLKDQIRNVITIANPSSSDFLAIANHCEENHVSSGNIDKALSELWDEYEDDPQSLGRLVRAAYYVGGSDLSSRLLLLANGAPRAHAEEALLSAISESRQARAYEYHSLFSLMLELTDQGFDQFEHATATALVDDYLASGSYSRFLSSSGLDTFKQFINGHFVSDMDDVVLKTTQLRGSMSESEWSIKEKDWKNMMQFLVEYYQTAPLPERAAAAQIMESADPNNTRSYVRDIVGPLDAASLLNEITALDDPEQRDAVARFGSSQITWTDGSELLGYLYACKELGVQPSTCYPHGVAIDLGLEALPDSDLEDPENRADRYIVISHSETRPDIEMKTVGITEDTEQDIMLRYLGFDTAVGEETFFAPDYDGRSLIAYNTRLETQWMDDIPLEHFPASLAECDTMIVLSTGYVRNDTLRLMIERTRTETVNYHVINESSHDFYLEAPMYDCVQQISLRDRATASLIPFLTFTCTTAPLPEPDEWQTSGDQFESYLRPYLFGYADNRWSEECMEELIGRMAAGDWTYDVFIGQTGN